MSPRLETRQTQLLFCYISGPVIDSFSEDECRSRISFSFQVIMSNRAYSETLVFMLVIFIPSESVSVQSEALKYVYICHF